ncbi:acyltransferase [Pseudomonas matsuisoli]|uniref:Acyltransferase n=1 Tax=Pseudomonas matsuisoli TaxID=1515666 RepID=A0A917Q0L4_9PSED|nr:acyltransferase [Pseudomonas matsuisoli]GGK04634.1 acyltransferase [Pseudomonas matsuisoli]
MRPFLTAASVLLLAIANTVIMIIPLMAIALLKLILPSQSLRRACSIGVMRIAEAWAEVTKAIFGWLTPTRWDIRGLEKLRRDTSYLIISNHQSWVDIPALLQTFNRRTPYFKFFLKSELIWIPLLGLAFWALDYPFMKRYSKAKLDKYPHLKGKDLEITKAACEKFKDLPVAIINYLEGTRFTPAKHAEQASPYRYLLKPKAGGVAFVMAAIGHGLDAILDVTIVYPGERAPGFWALISGQLPEVIIDVRVRPLDPSLCDGDYQNDPAFRARVQAWVSDLWAEKDALIASIKGEGVTRLQSTSPRT